MTLCLIKIHGGPGDALEIPSEPVSPVQAEVSVPNLDPSFAPDLSPSPPTPDMYSVYSACAEESVNEYAARKPSQPADSMYGVYSAVEPLENEDKVAESTEPSEGKEKKDTFFLLLIVEHQIFS